MFRLTYKNSSFEMQQFGHLVLQSYVPLYVQLADRIAEVIRSGRLAPGTLLPSETVCEKHFNVSRLTVRHAMQNLTAEGLIYREKGRGTFVAPLKMEHDIAFSFEEEMHASNLEIKPHLITWKLVKPLPNVVAALHTRRGESIYRLERLRLVSDNPIGREVRHLPQDVGEKLSVDELRTEPIFLLVQNATGQRINRIFYTIGAVAASARDADLLKTRKGAPLLAREHTYYNQNDSPLLHGTTYFLGENYRFHFESGSKQIRMGSKLDRVKIKQRRAEKGKSK